MLCAVRGATIRSPLLIHLAVLAGYLLLAWAYTHPLLSLAATHIAGDPPGDPLLNASVLWWNATTVPLTSEWWNPPYYHPSHGVTAFTENLLGIAPIATPIYWLTGNPLITYNVSLFLTWPLCAFSSYLLAWYLTRRLDAAVIAGVAFGFSAYRTAELGHIQMMAVYWMPLALLSLHGYVAERRARWLLLFGATWLLQSLANLYLMLFGGVLIGLWLVYFCSSRTGAGKGYRAAAAIVVTWAAASLPLLAILVKYRSIHDYYGLVRTLSEPLGFSYPIETWLAVSSVVWSWSHLLPDDGKNHFPGATILVLVAAGMIARFIARQPQSDHVAARRRIVTIVLSTALVVSVMVIVVTMFIGGWQITAGGVRLRVNDLDRAVAIAIVSGVALIWRSTRSRDALVRRSPFVFYVFAAVAMWICAIGPVVPANGIIVLDPAPYRLLMALPGFDNVRVPARFWMVGVLCLSVAAGFSYRAFTPPPLENAEGVTGRSRSRSVSAAYCSIRGCGA
jgi:hypothetical protein